MLSLRRAIPALAIAMAVPVCAAQAATFTVDRTDDADVSACSTVANDCTLRGAINKANASAGADTIDFADNVRGTIQLSGSQLPAVTTALTINGPGTDQLALSANSQSRIMANSASGQLKISGLLFTEGAAKYANNTDQGYGNAISNNGTLTLAQCVFSRNNHYSSGGAINNIGTLSIDQSSFTDNSCYYNGGAILNSGTLTMSNSTVANNFVEATGGRGGGIANSGTATVINSTISGNSAKGYYSGSSSSTSASGGGIYNAGAFTLRNCTLGDNSIASRTNGVFCGGAICSESGSLVLDSCTITANFASKNNGGGVLLGGNVTIGNTIISGNSQSDVDASTTTLNLTDKGYNLLGTGTAISRFNGPGNQIGADPKFGTFFNYGGFTSTYELQPGSPAIDAGQTTLSTDQRGIARPQGGAADIGAYELQPSVAEPLSLTVTTAIDLTSNDGETSLREAMLYANTLAGTHDITFASNVRGKIALNGATLPTVTGQTNIIGPGARSLTIQGASAYRLMRIGAGAACTVSGLTFKDGITVYNSSNSTNLDGGAILNQGTLTVSQDAFVNNGASNGGAISNGGALTVEGSTFTGNNGSYGGAISSGIFPVTDASAGVTALIKNSTFDSNSAYFNGGAVANVSGQVTLDSCTITANSATFSQDTGGGVAAYIGQNTRTTLTNCIVVGNTGNDLSAEHVAFDPDTSSDANPFVSGGFNLIGSGNAVGNGKVLDAFNQSGDRTGVTDAKLGPLADNGGPTQTRALLAGSPAIDAGKTAFSTDQRGIARPQGGAADIGAYEVQAAAPPSETPSLIVTTLDDVTANDNQTSLREAIGYANSKAGADTISFADNVRGNLKLNGSALPAITSEILINGPGAPNLTLDGDGKSNLIVVNSGGQLQLNDLTLSGGTAPSNGLGGAIVNAGVLEAHQIVVSGNRANEGGGIVNTSGSVALYNSTISGNVATNSGGGIFNNNGSVSIVNSTVSGNSATGRNLTVLASGGGGLDSFGDKARVSLECATIAGNDAPNVADGVRAGVWIENGQLQMHNSILSGNGSGSGARDLQNESGAINSTGYNIVGQLNASSGLAASDRVGVDPQLGALADNGGPTLTRALLPGSPAINTGDPAIQGGFDQRGGGFARVRGGIADVGAFETQSDAATPIVTLSPRNPTTNQTLTAAPSGFVAGATYAYVWKKNGAVIAGEKTAQLDLSRAGNGDAGDVITVEVSANNTVRTAGVAVVNSAPFASGRNVSVPADTEIAIELRGSDADGDALTFEPVNAPANGTAEIRVDSTDGTTKLFYRSRARYNGVEVLRFVAVDSAGAKSPEATLGIDVQYSAPPVNRAPVAGDTNIDTYVGDSVVKGLLGSDPDGDALTFRIVSNAKYGRSEIRRDADGQFKLFYTSLNRFYGPDRVTYVAVDDKGKQSNVATVGINFINRAPVAQNNDLAVASGELVSQYLFATDADGDAVTFQLVNNPRYGTGAIKRDEQGKWRVYYRSAPGYVGPDRITFIAIDAQGKQSNVAVANINVVRVTSAPSGGAS